MTRPTHSERLRVRERYRLTHAKWKARQPKSELVTCVVCGTKKPRASCLWGNGGGMGDSATCCQTHMELLRQRKAGAA
jgi:hypothetical protein